MLKKILTISGIVCVLLFICNLCSCDGNSIAQAEQRFMSRCNQQLDQATHPFRKGIEGLHYFVSVKDAKVTKVSVTTIDGKDDVGKNDSNIDTVYFVVDALWEGRVMGTKGRTVAGFLCKPDKGNLKLVDISSISSTAVITPENLRDLRETIDKLAPIIGGIVSIGAAL